MDPYAGSPQDPQSLHKYLYCHANPVNGIDPSGKDLLIGLVVFAAISVLLIGALCGVLAYRGAMIRSGPRGDAYINFTNFDLSRIVYADGTVPNEDFVQTSMLEYINAHFNRADVTVSELSVNSRVTLSTPVLCFSQEANFSALPNGSTQIEWGREMVGGVRPEIFLGNFEMDELNNRFTSSGNFTADQRLARALAFLCLHELGHSYKLDHNDGYDNIMRTTTTYGAVGTGPGGVFTGYDVLNSLLRNDSFSENEIEVIKNVATTGRRNS